MARRIQIASVAAVAETAGLEVRSLGDSGLGVFLEGPFVATVIIQVYNGVFWANAKDPGGAVISGITSPGYWVIPGQFTAVRANVTAYTSGTVTLKTVEAD